MSAKFILIAGLILISVIILSCGKPGVKHTSIDGEVKAINIWEMHYQDIDTPGISTGSTQFNLADSLEATARLEHTREYAGLVESILASRGHKLIEAGSARGIISIRISWRKIEKYEKAPERFEDKLYNEDEFMRQDKRRRDSLNLDIAYLGWKLFGKMYEVSKVEVDILDKKGRSLGRLYIGGKSADKVKPDYVADVIDNILKEGKY